MEGNIEAFGENVLSLVRNSEGEGRGKDGVEKIGRKRELYRTKSKREEAKKGLRFCDA